MIKNIIIIFVQKDQRHTIKQIKSKIKSKSSASILVENQIKCDHFHLGMRT